MKPWPDTNLQYDTVPEAVLNDLRGMESTMMEKRRIYRVRNNIVSCHCSHTVVTTGKVSV
jgi:hypothetical protein